MVHSVATASSSSLVVVTTCVGSSTFMESLIHLEICAWAGHANLETSRINLCVFPFLPCSNSNVCFELNKLVLQNDDLIQQSMEVIYPKAFLFSETVHGPLWKYCHFTFPYLHLLICPSSFRREGMMQ